MNVITSSGDFCSSYCEGTKLSYAWSYVLTNLCCNTNSFCFPLRLHFKQQCLQSCQRNGQAFVEAPLQACSRCCNSGTQCVKLLVFVWSADCEESNKQAMLKLVQEKTDGTLPQELQFSFSDARGNPCSLVLKRKLSQLVLVQRGRKIQPLEPENALQ